MKTDILKPQKITACYQTKNDEQVNLLMPMNSMGHVINELKSKEHKLTKNKGRNQNVTKIIIYVYGLSSRLLLLINVRSEILFCI